MISIIIPTHNRAHLIGETIESIQNQTYKNWECIIIDDGSTDHTESLIAEYCAADSRIQYYKKPNNFPKGPSAARNYGFKKSKGGYINWFDSDDIMHPEKLETDLKHIQSGEYDFTISQSQFFSESGTPQKKYWNKQLWSDDPINDFIKMKIGWGVNASLWKRSSLNAIGLRFNENLMTADDFLYHIQALEKDLKPIIIKKTLSFLRVHPKRLNDYRVKSPFKLTVNLYLIKKKKQLKLKEQTIDYLNNQFRNQYLNLLKNKKLNLAISFLFKALSNHYKGRLKVSLINFFLIGCIYKLTGYGYKFLE
ncbi:glycosyltransferase family 2 protein [Marixanthomonas spongiae]|uniref:Glycosyltransferase 2-like domain-containing protein n=1 Tax=Marixanthomonas spongiae TaxID=2174845 RepID=A0A2U0I5S4_9FLAO|nr:glycosyltransferase family 2 protein [Marixanthomonas spongiae]PVW16456.1 hypothetical protein DDV96_04150 [Marixanthomonas spongiae]